ncbi:MAG: endolytic transglycosylase MltG, partial [Patescibacteria group bacterium]
SPLLRDFSGEADLLLGKPRLTSLEGYLFPDTYFFLKSDTPEDVVIKMLSNLERRITPELREEIARQGKSTHDALTVASLLEEEAREDEDRRIIAGILWKRIEKGMPLQVDAALTYVTGKASLSLSNGDLRQDSPYNTYKQKGLPLGPISNPGLAAIDAALHPAETEYLFYLSDRTGILYSAKTHEGHVANKRKYLSRE